MKKLKLLSHMNNNSSRTLPFKIKQDEVNKSLLDSKLYKDEDTIIIQNRTGFSNQKRKA